MDMRVRNENQYVLKMFGMKAENIQRIKGSEDMWSFQLTDVTGAKLRGKMHYYTGKDQKRHPSALNVLNHYVQAQHNVNYNSDKTLTPAQKETFKKNEAIVRDFENAFPSKMNEIDSYNAHAVGNNCLLDSDVAALPAMPYYEKRIEGKFLKPKDIDFSESDKIVEAQKELLYVQEKFGLTFDASYREQEYEDIKGHRYFTDVYDCTFTDRNGRTFETPFKLASGHGTPSEEELRPLDVLNSVALDCAGITDYDNYEEFAQEFGYDPDSRKGEKIYQSLIEQKNTLDRVFPGVLDKMRDDPCVQYGGLTEEARAKIDQVVARAQAKDSKKDISR